VPLGVLANVDVDDVSRGADFYCRAFGLRVGRRLGPEVVELLGAAVPIYLLEKAPGSPPTTGAAHGRAYRRHWTPVHLDFVVDDVEAAVARAVAAGARLEGGISTHPWGRLAVLADPFGHGLCLLQFTGRGYDEIAE
jgi:predicted enzyme related to lactoylglutathione lyase